MAAAGGALAERRYGLHGGNDLAQQAFWRPPRPLRPSARAMAPSSSARARAAAILTCSCWDAGVSPPRDRGLTSVRSAALSGLNRHDMSRRDPRATFSAGLPGGYFIPRTWPRSVPGPRQAVTVISGNDPGGIGVPRPACPSHPATRWRWRRRCTSGRRWTRAPSQTGPLR